MGWGIGISMVRDADRLRITIETVRKGDIPTATILNYSGEVIETFCLINGLNELPVTPYMHKNYSIRIINGKNVIVQKL